MLQEAVARTGIRQGTFVDFFAGSGVVSRLAKALGYRTIANDWEPYTREINGAYIGCNAPPEFRRLGAATGLGGAEAVFAALNDLPPRVGYVTRHLCPRDDQQPDPQVDRLFFTRRNGSRIDAMRAQIRDWEEAGLLNPAERSFLLASLLYGASYVSNTSGVFKGFHRGWGGATGTALYRILAELRLSPPRTLDNGQANRVTALDAQALAATLAAEDEPVDLAYLDPPYNQHPYGSNYHVLNTIALGDQPPVGTAIGRRDKAAIRQDWRTGRRSAYNYRREAAPALEQLLATVQSRYLLLSYSTDGLIPVESVLAAACRRGPARAITRRYKRYRVSSQRYSARGYNVEFVLIIPGDARPAPGRAAELAEQIRRAEEGDDADTDRG
jgi:adenine-specific DNA-methyltransferase